MTSTTDVAFSPAVKAMQSRMGSRDAYARVEAKGGWRREIDAGFAAFVAERDSFYLATASADGQPYIQHRGGVPGFLKVLSPTTLGFADFGGNRQYISAGNLSENDRVQLFLMDYAGRRRVKVWGRARVVEDDPALLERLADPAYDATVERAIVIDVAAWDVNCPQHITPRYTEPQVAQVLQKLTRRIEEPQAELAAIKTAT